MRIIITLLTAMSLMLNSSCGSTTNLRLDEHSNDESENVTTTESTVTQESESTTADDETTAPETAKPIDEYNDDELQDIIDRSLDTLTENTTGLLTTEELAAAHPEEFGAIISLGKRAIPFLEKYIDTDRDMTSKEAACCVMAKAAAYAIDPSLYDLVFESPDKSANLKLSVRSFEIGIMGSQTTNYGKLSLITDSDTIELGEFDCVGADVSWSNSGNYAVLTGGGNNDRVSPAASLIDIPNKKILELPSLGIYNRILADEPELKSFLSFSVKGCDWSSDNPTIGFELEVGAAFYPQVIHGEYTLDAKTNELTNITYDPLPAKASAPGLTDEEIKKIVDENLDVLLTDSDGYYSEKEFISAHPDAFDNIVSLGSTALPYLKEIGSGYSFVGEDTSGNNRCFMARAAAYVIAPDIYDRAFPSPNGKYSIEAAVNSFFGLTDPFQGIKYNLNMRKSETNEVLAIADKPYQLYSDLFADANIQWSPDGKYASLQDTYRNMYSYIHVFDTENSAFYSLPKEHEIEAAIGKKLEYTDENGILLNNLHCLIEKWEGTNVTVRIVLSDSAGDGEAVGWYLYDLKNRDIVKIQVDLREQNISENDAPNKGTFIYLHPEASVNIRADYPLLSGDTPAVGLINSQINEYVGSVYKGWIESNSTAANDSVESVMRYEITRLDEDILSIHFSASFAGGGSAQYVTDAGLTFDMKTGESVALESLYDFEKVSSLIDSYFDSLDKAQYPTLFSLYEIDEIRKDFHSRFAADSSYRDRSFCVGSDRIYLFAGMYKGYTLDVDFPLEGERAFVAEISLD